MLGAKFAFVLLFLSRELKFLKCEILIDSVYELKDHSVLLNTRVGKAQTVNSSEFESQTSAEDIRQTKNSSLIK